MSIDEMVKMLAEELGIPIEQIKMFGENPRPSMVDVTNKAEAAKVVDEMDKASIELVKALFADAASTQSSDHDSDRFVPKNPRDWLAVHNLIAEIGMTLGNVALDCMMHASAHIRMVENRRECSVKDAYDFATSTTMLVALKMVMKSHRVLVKQGALLSDNADLHYDRIIGMCEEYISEKRRENEARAANRRAPGTRSEDRREGASGEEDETEKGEVGERSAE